MFESLLGNNLSGKKMINSIEDTYEVFLKIFKELL